MIRYIKKYMLKSAIAILALFMCNPAWADWDSWRAASERGDYVTAYQEVLKMADQGDTEAQYMVGYYLTYGLGVVRDPVKGREWIQEAANNGNASAMNSMAYAWAINDERLDEALDLIQNALARDPNNPYFLDTLAWVFYKLQQYEKALEPMCQSIRALPGHPESRTHLAQIYFQLGLYEEAKNEWLAAIDLEERRFLLAQGNPGHYLSVLDLDQWRAELQQLIRQADEKLKSQALPVNPLIKPCLNSIS